MDKRFKLDGTFYLKLIFSLVVLYRVFSLDIYPAISNDSIHYLNKTVSKIYFSEPLRIIQPGGSKFSGYPLYLSIWHNLSSFLPVDGLTLMALSQRVFLAVSLVWLIFNMGLFSIPIALLFSTGIFLAQSNLILTEGMTMPLGIMFSISLVNVFKIRGEKDILASPKLWFLFLVLSITFCFILLAKINIITFVLPLLILAFAVERCGYKLKLKPTRIVWPITLLIFFASAYVVAISIDNYRQFNDFSPIMGKSRILYYGAWTQVFHLYPENRKNPELAEFFDKGSPYNFIHGVEKNCGGLGKYNCTYPIQKMRAHELLDRANISLAAERIRSFTMGFIGGGKQELQATRNNFMKFNGLTLPDSIQFSNYYTRKYGKEKFFSIYNGGEHSKVIRGFEGSAISRSNVRVYQALITVFPLIVMGWLLVKGKLYFNTPYFYVIFSYSIMIGSLALYFVDIWRYIISAWSIFVVILFYGISTAMERSRM